MTEAKVRLSFEVPGATMLSSQECDENPNKNYKHQSLTIEVKPKKGKPHRETLHIKTRNSRPAKQTIIICEDAYNYMISNDGKPESLSRISQYKWEKMMNTKSRLKVHMDLIAESLGGYNPTWEILDD